MVECRWLFGDKKAKLFMIGADDRNFDYGSEGFDRA